MMRVLWLIPLLMLTSCASYNLDKDSAMPLVYSGITDVASSVLAFEVGEGIELNRILDWMDNGTIGIVITAVALKGTYILGTGLLSKEVQHEVSGIVSAGQYGATAKNLFVAASIGAPWDWIIFGVVGVYYYGCWEHYIPEKFCLVGY